MHHDTRLEAREHTRVEATGDEASMQENEAMSCLKKDRSKVPATMKCTAALPVQVSQSQGYRARVFNMTFLSFLKLLPCF